MIKKLIAFVILSLFASVEQMPAQQTQKQEEVPRFSQEVSISIINLYASVRDSKGRPVRGLKKEDFKLSVNGKRQTITNFSADITEPVNIAFLLDVSGSMGMMDKFETAKGIVREIIQRLSPEDEVALMIFADGSVEMLVEFTKDKQRLIDRMEKLKPFGGTALRNAVAFCSRLLIANVGKKGVVLLSDGVDTRSDLTLEEATAQAAKVELPIYAFELIRSKWVEEGLEKSVDDVPLQNIADSTGGLYFSLDPTYHRDLNQACSKIFEDLKYQYYIGYTPGSDSSYGRLDLKTKNRKHRVRVRYSVVHGG